MLAGLKENMKNNSNLTLFFLSFYLTQPIEHLLLCEAGSIFRNMYIKSCPFWRRDVEVCHRFLFWL